MGSSNGRPRSPDDDGARPGGELRETVCVLTGDRFFPSTSPCEVVEDGLLYCVQGSFASGMVEFADDPSASLTPSNELPLSAVDIVRWAGLRPVHLDKASFIKQWRRYLASVSHMVEHVEGGGARAQRLATQGHLFARKLLQRFDECDFLISESENPRGGLVILLHDDLAPLTPLMFFIVEGCTMRPAETRVEEPELALGVFSADQPVESCQRSVKDAAGKRDE